MESYEPNMNNKRYKEEYELDEFDPMAKHYYAERKESMLGPIGAHNIKKPKLFVTHFCDGTTNEGLTNMFVKYGEVLDVRIHESANGYKFAFVTYKNIDQAVTAIDRLHLRAPHRLRIEFAKEKNHNKKVEVFEPIVISVPPTYNPPIMPLVLSNARKNLKKSEFFNLLDPLQCYNNYLIRLFDSQRNEGKL